MTDALGRPLAAWIEGFAADGVRGLRILIDDATATYPITVDPVITGPAWTVESNQVSAYLGNAVAAAGDVNGDGYGDVLVGAYAFDYGQTDEGRAYLFHGSASGLATSPAWYAESNQAGAGFGRSVATAGDVNHDGYSDVIIGVPWYDDGQTDEGGAYVYMGSATGLGTMPAWIGESNQAGASFGVSVSTAGDVNGDGYSDVIIGAYQYDNGQTNEGRAFVYRGSATGLVSTGLWWVEGNQGEARLGYSVSTAGDVNGDGYSDVIVGADQYDNDSVNEGRAFVYHGSATGLGAAVWNVEGGHVGASLGSSVGTAGDVNGDGYSDVIVGAVGYGNGEASEGRALVYLGSASGLAATHAWAVEGGQANAALGTSVGTAGDVNGDGYAEVIVGAPGYDDDGVDEGRALLFMGSASGPRPSPDWTGEGGQAQAYYGCSAGTAGDVNGDGLGDIIVGAFGYDNGQAEEGRALVYQGTTSGIATAAGWVTEGNSSEARYGSSVAAGDLNGDGYSDVAVGAPGFDGGEADEGRVQLFYGSSSGLATSPAWTAEGNQAGALFGSSVALADVTRNGFAELIVGAPGASNGEALEGRAFVYAGSGGGPPSVPLWTAEGNQAGAAFGTIVAGLEDVNGDGGGDLLVSAPYYDNGALVDAGRVYVYACINQELSPEPRRILDSDQANAWFGLGAGSAGDVNGDGFSDVIVGAPGYANTLYREGRVYVFHGSLSGLPATANWVQEQEVPNAWFGFAVGRAGDVNGDGYSDVIVGAPMAAAPMARAGRAYVYLGSATGLAAGPVWTVDGPYYDVRFGESVAAAGDVNGDGYADILVGAPHAQGDLEDEGLAYLYLGSAMGPSLTPAWTGQGDQAGSQYGGCVGSAGDVNGDGFADLIVTAKTHDNGQADEGRAYLHYGNGGPGVPVRDRQRNEVDTLDIGPMGTSESETGFTIAAVGRTPFGRGDFKLEWELKPLGTLFNGTGLQRSAAWSDTGVAGLDLHQLVSGLSTNGKYHWRVRRRYDTANVPYLGHGRWVSPVWNGPQEMDLRTWTWDHDLDGRDYSGDCDDGNPEVWSIPSFVATLYMENRTALSWTAPQAPGCAPGALRYDVLRTAVASDFTISTCVASDIVPQSTTDPAYPSPGTGWFYLVRADSACPTEGPLGWRGDGMEILGRPCP